MRRNLEKSLHEFDELINKDGNRKGKISVEELLDLLRLSLKESDKWGENPQLIDLIYTPWKAGYMAGYKQAKNDRRSKTQRVSTD